MINTYTLLSKKLTGYLELQYNDGSLKAILLAFKERLSQDQFQLLANNIPMQEERIEALAGIGFTITRQMAANEKLGLFCRMYEKHVGIKYIVSAADSGKIKLIKIDEAMLVAYFTSQNFLFKGKYSISNLVKNYNELRAEMAAPAKSKHPDHFSKQYQDRLDPQQCSEYWQHLHSLGLRPVKVHGVVTDWIKQ